MQELFKQRRQAALQLHLKYLRFVFNDHFIVFLLIAAGFLLVEYVQILKQGAFPIWGKFLVFFVASLFSLSIGQVAVRVKKADQLFLLTKETALIQEFRRSILRSLFLPAISSFFLVVLAAPVLGVSPVLLFVWWLLLVFLKAGFFWLKLSQLTPSRKIDWEKLLAYANNREAKINRRYALFAQVKTQKRRVVRRKYLDFLLPQKIQSPYSYLHLRVLLRTGEYFGLGLRLLFLALLLIFLLKKGLFLYAILTLLNYLILFQLFSAGFVANQHPLFQIYPNGSNLEGSHRALRRILFYLLLGLIAFELVLSLLLSFDKAMEFLLFALINTGFLGFYVYYRFNKK